MPSREAGWVGLFLSGLFLAALLFAGLVLIELFVDAPSRRTATRIAAAVVLGFAVSRMRTLVRLRLAGQPRSALDSATEAPPAPVDDRTRFHQLCDEVRSGTRSQRYFDLVFWPRLVALAKSTGAAPLDKPAGRSFGRGPSLPALARVVAAIEARR